MSNCLNCDTPLDQVPKKRAKKFCDSTCRSNYWQKQNSNTVKNMAVITESVKSGEMGQIINELIYRSRHKEGLFLIRFEADGFTKSDFDSLLTQMNALPRSVPNGFYHFDYADDRLIETATAGETVTITLTKDNIAPFDREKKTKEIINMPQAGIHSQPAEVTTKGNKITIIGNSHKKWQPGDPKEGTGGFFMRFGAFTYDDPEFKRE